MPTVPGPDTGREAAAERCARPSFSPAIGPGSKRTRLCTDASANRHVIAGVATATCGSACSSCPYAPNAGPGSAPWSSSRRALGVSAVLREVDAVLPRRLQRLHAASFVVSAVLAPQALIAVPWCSDAASASTRRRGGGAACTTRTTGSAIDDNYDAILDAVRMGAVAAVRGHDAAPVPTPSALPRGGVRRRGDARDAVVDGDAGPGRRR
jgi:hypothetical protein